MTTEAWRAVPGALQVPSWSLGSTQDYFEAISVVLQALCLCMLNCMRLLGGTTVACAVQMLFGLLVDTSKGCLQGKLCNLTGHLINTLFVRKHHSIKDHSGCELHILHMSARLPNSAFTSRLQLNLTSAKKSLSHCSQCYQHRRA